MNPTKEETNEQASQSQDELGSLNLESMFKTQDCEKLLNLTPRMKTDVRNACTPSAGTPLRHTMLTQATPGSKRKHSLSPDLCNIETRNSFAALSEEKPAAKKPKKLDFTNEAQDHQDLDLNGFQTVRGKKNKTSFEDKIENSEEKTKTNSSSGFIYVIFTIITGRAFSPKHAETLARAFKTHLKGELNEKLAEFTKMGPIFQIRQGLLNKTKSFKFNNLGLPQLKMEIRENSPNKTKNNKKQENKTKKEEILSKGVVELEGMDLDQFENTYDFERNNIIGFNTILNKLGKRTNKAIITFSTKIAPLKIIGELFSKKVSPLLYNVIRCSACQKFGHVGKKCRSNFFVCTYCAGAHPSSTCTVKYNPYYYTCANCSGNHTTFYQQCPTYLKYKAIIDQKNDTIKAEWEKRIKETEITTQKNEIKNTPPTKTCKKDNKKIQQITKTEIKNTGNAIISKTTLATILKTLLNPNNLNLLQTMDEETRNKTIDEIIEKPTSFEKQDEIKKINNQTQNKTETHLTKNTQNESDPAIGNETPETPETPETMEEITQPKTYAEITSPKNTDIAVPSTQRSTTPTEKKEKIAEQLETVVKKTTKTKSSSQPNTIGQIGHRQQSAVNRRKMAALRNRSLGTAGTDFSRSMLSNLQLNKTKN